MPTEHRINLTAAEVRAWQAGGRELRRRVKPQPPPPECCGGLTVVLRDIPETGLAFAAYESDRNDNFVEYRPIPQLSNDRWHSPFGQPGDVLCLRKRIKDVGKPVHWMSMWFPRVRTVTVKQVDGTWWWVARVEEIGGER